jgi:hypothetical protein
MMEPQPDQDQERWGNVQRSIISFCRQRLARERARRGFFPSALVADSRGMPALLRTSPANQQLLLSHGNVVWAHLVQANSLLLRPGPLDLQGWVVYGRDRSFDRGIDELERISNILYGWKENVPAEPELARWADRLREMNSPFYNLPVPSSVSGGRAVSCTTTMVFRDHLPGGILVGSWFPYLVLDELKQSMILPGAYWPARLCEDWRKEAAAREGVGQEAP